MFNKHNDKKNQYMLEGKFKKQGYDWWWHSFTAINENTNEERQFFIEYFIINPGLSDTVIYGDHGKNKPSYLMIKAGTWGVNKCQLHRFVDLKDVTIMDGVPFLIEGKDFRCDENHLIGNIHVEEASDLTMSDQGSMSWNLHVEKIIPYNVGYGTSDLFRKIKAFEMYWHVSGMKSEYSGEIIFNGEKYIATKDNSYGYADKNWGSNFTSPWVWLSSNCIESNLTHKKLDNTVFDFGGGRPKIFFVPLNRKLLGGLYYEGKEYEYNFSKFWTFPTTDFHCLETENEVIWQIRFSNLTSVCRVEVSCKKKDMLLVKYESPDGLRRHSRLWNGGNGKGKIQLYRRKWNKLELVDDLSITHIGCEYGEYDQ